MEDLSNNSGANEQDRISALPNEVIHRILSFGVDLNVIVQTSVLSKRWVNLWSTFPFLNFTPLRSILASDAKYLNFITKFLLRRSQQVETCSVNIDLNGINESVGGIVLLILFLVVSHSVEKLHISSVKLLSYLSFPVLKELSLSQCNVSLTKWSLPWLTTLDFESLSPRSQEIVFSFNQFQSLKNLSLLGCFGLVHLWNPDSIRIDLPNLETLTILHIKHIQFPECKFVYRLFLLRVDEYQMNETMLKISSLFSAFGKTKVLVLFPKTFQVLSSVPNFFKHKPSPFVNLNELYLVGNATQQPRYEYPSRSTNHVIKYLLSNSPGAKIIPLFYSDGQYRW